MGLNGLFLLSVSFLPFPTGLHSAYPDDQLAMILYAAAQLPCGMSLLAIWGYAARGHRLVDPEISSVFVRSVTARLMIAPAMCVVAIGTALISIPLSKVVLFSIPVLYISFLIFDGWQKSDSPKSDNLDDELRTQGCICARNWRLAFTKRLFTGSSRQGKGQDNL